MDNLYILCNRNDSAAQVTQAVSFVSVGEFQMHTVEFPSMGKSLHWNVVCCVVGNGSLEIRMVDSFGVHIKNAYSGLSSCV